MPVFANTGLSIKNIDELLSKADGAIVETSLKQNGITWSKIEEKRVLELMKEANELGEVKCEI